MVTCLLKMPVAKAGKSRASAGARTVHSPQEFAGNVSPHSDASSDTFNFAALRKPQWLRHGLTSIGVAQVSLIPRMEFGSRSRGLPPEVVPRPWLFVARRIGVYGTRSEVSLVDKCVRKLIGFATSGSPLLLPSCIPVVTRYVEKFRCGEKLWNH